jgi:hypothetical protein
MARWHALETLVTDELADQEAVFAERLGVLQEAIEERLSAKMSAPGEHLTL